MARKNDVLPVYSSRRRWAALTLVGMLSVGVFASPVPSAFAQEEGDTPAVTAVLDPVALALEAAREKAHQSLMDLPAWNATIFGPFPAAAITTEANDITYVHINLPSKYGKKSASVRMGMLKDKSWVNTTLGSITLNVYGNGTYKTAVQMPSGTRAQIYVGGKLITTTIRA